MKPTLSTLALIVANLVPLAGVFLMGWDAAIIVLLYWTENLVIGFYNTLKIALVKVSDPPVGHLGKLFAIPFFWLHFGGFCGMHGLFLLVIFKRGSECFNFLDFKRRRHILHRLFTTLLQGVDMFFHFT